MPNIIILYRSLKWYYGDVHIIFGIKATGARVSPGKEFQNYCDDARADDIIDDGGLQGE